MRRVLIFAIAALALVVLVGVVYIRSVGHDPTLWHVDPLDAPTPDSPNSFRVAPVLHGYEPVTAERIDAPAPIYDANPAIIAQALDQFVLSQPRVERVAGTPETGWMTYVARSETMRYPDCISILLLDLGEGLSTVAIFSRSRFGYGDLGVNRARVEAWLKTLTSFETELPGS